MIALAVLLPNGTAASTTAGGRTPLILGGKGVPQGELPSLVLVAYLIPNGKEEVVTCTGTVVAPRVVLTAAHCVELKNIFVTVENFRVVAGAVNWTSPQRQVLKDVKRTVTYKTYVEGRGFPDAAVLELEEPVGVPSMKVAGRHFWSGNTGATMTGWGKTSALQKTATYVLHRGGTVIHSSSWCRHEGVEPELLCTTGNPNLRTSACYGDSGGPLLVRQPWDHRLVSAGVLHGGTGCIRQFGINNYTPTYRLQGWLQKRIAEAEAPAPPK